MNNGEHSIGRCISILYRYGQNHVGKKLESYNIGRGQYVILLTLFRNGGVSQEELADFLKLDKGCIAKSIKKLEEEGYVERNVDMSDKRAYKVFLTQKAMDTVADIQSIILGWEDIITKGLSFEERQSVENILQEMADKALKFKADDEGSNK